MGRKRLSDDEKRNTYHITIKQKIIDEFKEELEKKGEIPSRVIEELIKEYLKKSENEE